MTNDSRGDRPPHRVFTAPELDAAFDQVMNRFRALAPAERAALDDAVDRETAVRGEARTSAAPPTRDAAWHIRTALIRKAEADAARIKEDAAREAAASREIAARTVEEAHEQARDIVTVAHIEAASHSAEAPARRELMAVGGPVVLDAPVTPRPDMVATAERVTSRLLAEAELSDVVDAALAGERGAVQHLLARIQPLVLRYCHARVGTRERSLVSAEDIAQEVCLAVLQALDHYRYEPGSFLAFVYGIAAHKVADARRRAVRDRSEVVPELPDTPTADDSVEQRAMNGELIESVTRLLHKLPEKQREILVLRVAVGLSAEETAAAVGSTPGAVRVAQHRALASMRAMFAAVEE